MPSHRRDSKEPPTAQESSSSSSSDDDVDDDEHRNNLGSSALKVRLSFNPSYRAGQSRLEPSPGRDSYPPINFCSRLSEDSQQTAQMSSSRPPAAHPFPVLTPSTTWSRRHSSNPPETASPPSRDRSFQCRECGRAFYDGSRLRTHLRIHSGELPFECGFCFKSFISKYRLDRHQLIHSGTRAFRCELCGQTFVTKDKLSRHHVIHTGERLSCDQCDKTFSRKDKLSRHRLTVHFPKAS